MKIANKISLSFLAGTLILSSIAASIFYVIAKESLRKSIYNNLATACFFRSDHIKTYLKMLEISVGQLSKSVVLENFLKINGKEDPRQADAFAQATMRLKRTKEANPAIAEFLLLDKAGKVVASSSESSLGADKSTDAYFLGAQKGVYIKDAYFSEVKKMPLMAVSAPILDSQTQEFLGVLVARVRLTDLNNITVSEIGMSKTGEIYIVNKYGYMITPSRFKEDAVLKQKVNTENVRGAWLHKDAEHVLSQHKLADVFYDYRGARVLGAQEYIPKMRWAVLAEIDAKEAFAPLAKLRLIFYLILFIVPIAAYLLGIRIAKFITGPLHRLHKGTEIIGSGNLDYKIGTNAKDEVGQLSRAFDAMTANLKTSTTSIENLDKEITERKKTEEALRNSEASFRAIFDHANDGILLADEETKKFYTGNNTACQMLGYSLEEIKNLGVPDIHPKEDLPYVIEQFERQVRKEISVAKDLPVKRKDGSVFYADVNTSSVTLAGRTYLLGLFRDITERKKAEEERESLFEQIKVLNLELEDKVTERTMELENAMQVLEEANIQLQEANAHKNKFLSTMSHELRTPLNGIIGFTDLLKGQFFGPLNEKQMSYVTQVESSSKHLLSLIDGLLTIIKVDMGKVKISVERFNIEEGIKVSVDMLQSQLNKKSIKVNIECDPQLLEINTDNSIFKQILLSLLDNAVKYTPEEGSITIRSTMNPNNVLISVTDTGIGIEPKDQEKLFSEFYQVDRVRDEALGGMGIGLALTKRLVNLHGGEIGVESNPGKGSTFWFTLPQI